jgi:hypothetical protein
VRNEPERFLDHLRLGLVGHRVLFRRLACDVLLLYVECEPGDGKGVTIWLDPIWRLRGPQGVVAGPRRQRTRCIARKDWPLSQRYWATCKNAQSSGSTSNR